MHLSSLRCATIGVSLALGLTSFGASPPALDLRIAEADRAFAERKTKERALRSLEIYRELFKEFPDDPRTGLGLARACYFTGIRLTSDASEKEKIYAEGRDAGGRALKANPQCGGCHFWTAINMALYGETVGIFKMLFSLKTIQEHLRQSITADPTYAYGGAHRLLGLIDHKLPGILGGNNKRAREHFEKAIAVAPDEPLNTLFLAQLLEKEFNDPSKAREIVEKALSHPLPSEERLEARDARTLLEKWLSERPKPPGT
jgi:tetratricopeptide (TPR) repeat protein